MENIDKFWIAPLFFHLIFTFFILKVFFKKLKKVNLVILTMFFGSLIFLIEEAIYVRTLTSQNLDSKYISESRKKRENDFLSFEQNMDYINCIHIFKTLGYLTCGTYYSLINNQNEEKYKGDHESFNLESRKEGFLRRLGKAEEKAIKDLENCEKDRDYFSALCLESFLILNGQVIFLFDFEEENRTQSKPEYLLNLVNRNADKAIEKLSKIFNSLTCREFNNLGDVYGNSVYSQGYNSQERRDTYLRLKLKSCFKENCYDTCKTIPSFYALDTDLTSYFNSFVSQVLVNKHQGLSLTKEHLKILKLLKTEYGLNSFDIFYNYLLQNYPKELIEIGQHETSREYWENAFNSTR